MQCQSEEIDKTKTEEPQQIYIGWGGFVFDQKIKDIINQVTREWIEIRNGRKEEEKI